MPDAAILVVSCDAYSDLWDPYFRLFRRYWPDCPFPVFLGSNFESYQSDTVTTICVGEDVSWADNLRKMLDHIGASRIILFLEDFFLVSQIDTLKVKSLVQLASEEGLGCLRLFPHPPPSRRVRHRRELGHIRPGDDYRVSTQVAIWDVETLRRLAWPGFSAWDFEIIGSIASNEMHAKFWGVYEPVIDYRNGVWRGRWLPEGLEACRAAGIEIDVEARGMFSPEEWDDKVRTTTSRSLANALLPESVLRWRRRMLRLWRGRHYMEKLLQDAKYKIS